MAAAAVASEPVPMPLSLMCLASPVGPRELCLEETTTKTTFMQLFFAIAAKLDIPSCLLKGTVAFENGSIVDMRSGESVLRYGPGAGLTCRLEDNRFDLSIVVSNGSHHADTTIAVYPSDSVEKLKERFPSA